MGSLALSGSQWGSRFDFLRFVGDFRGPVGHHFHLCLKFGTTFSKWFFGGLPGSPVRETSIS